METQKSIVLETEFKKLIDAGLCSRGTVAWTGRKRIFFGSDTDETYYDLASLTKALVNLIALILIDKGMISLDMKVAKILGLKGAHTSAVTLKHLLTYTVYFKLGGFNISSKGTSYRKFLEQLRQADLEGEPGQQFYYTNLAPILVGMVLEKITGMAMDQLVEQYLCTKDYSFTFAPPEQLCAENFCLTRGQMVRGITHDYTAWKAWNECGTRAMCAGLFARADDILALSHDLMMGKILSPDMMRLIQTNHVGHILRFDGTSRKFGLGFDLDESGIVLMNAYPGHRWAMDFEQEIAWVLLKNVIFRDPGYEAGHRSDSVRLRSHIFKKVA